MCIRDSFWPNRTVANLVPAKTYATTVFSMFIKNYWGSVQQVPPADAAFTVTQEIIKKMCIRDSHGPVPDGAAADHPQHARVPCPVEHGQDHRFASRYIGSDSNKELPFDSLESNPHRVILLDEIEKSDKAVQRLFLSAIDEGYIKTAQGKVVDFSKAIIIATTNAARDTAGKSLSLIHI